MVRMVRKQVYIRTDQDERLRQGARQTGLSESELIRRGIDSVLAVARPPVLDKEAGMSLIRLLKERAKLPPSREGGYKFNREEIYEERLNELERRRRAT